VGLDRDSFYCINAVTPLADGGIHFITRTGTPPPDGGSLVSLSGGSWGNGGLTSLSYDVRCDYPEDIPHIANCQGQDLPSEFYLEEENLYWDLHKGSPSRPLLRCSWRFIPGHTRPHFQNASLQLCCMRPLPDAGTR
jgi:hypothetical protein